MTLSIPAATYEQARGPHLRAMLAGLAEESEKLTWPLERLHHLRDERLRTLIRHAQRHSPWHSHRLRHIDLEALSGADLTAIPPMTKTDVMAHWDDIVTDRRLTLRGAREHLARVSAEGPAYLLDDYHVVTTGGSSGLVGLFPWDRDGWLAAALSSWRVFAWLARTMNLAQPGRTAFVAAAHASHVSEAMRRTFEPPGISCEIPVTLPLAEIVARLNAFRPDRIIAYPSMLRRLAFERRAGRLTVAPQVMLGGAEPLPPRMRADIEEAFDAPVVNFYATSETWTMACSPPGRTELHLAEDVAVYEPVDHDGNPVPPGRRAAKILVTNVINKVFPLIRYEIADEVTLLDGPNTEVWSGRRIAPVQGRHDDLFDYGDGVVVHPYIFWTPLWDARIAHYQVRQTPRGADVLVELRERLSLDTVRDELAAALRRAGLADPAVDVTAVDRIARAPMSGKIRSFVPLPRPAAGPARP
ncbi:coenzyme F390 synthetase [Paractinoplanes deccanensis]|uniref:Coenzyme F390 synthetase n=1 Tax=Paractinoplanes deccanensis TaxID=113561 RepID=A0ABQ3XY85_9ACTN|nr:phenylacetate--CoA ligase family protein [Actinoplanes deccanensis]GID72702.1 coenzyme F390 synthetase [Actinoplanes deccanensis]